MFDAARLIKARDRRRSSPAPASGIGIEHMHSKQQLLFLHICMQRMYIICKGKEETSLALFTHSARREEKNSSAGEKPVCLVYYNEGELC